MQAVAVLPTAHPVQIASPVELRAAFAETEQRRAAGRKRNSSVRTIDAQFLYRATFERFDQKRYRAGRDLNAEVPRLDDIPLGRLSPRLPKKRSIRRDR